MKRKSDDLDAALALARNLVAIVCRCGHVNDEHLMFGGDKRCAEKGCRCRTFTPAPLHVDRTEAA